MQRKPYVIARTADKRPTVQHRLLKTDPTRTVCGVDISRWPWRLYSTKPWGILLCLRCERRTLGS